MFCVRVADEKDDMANADSEKFRSIINKVESLHQYGKDRPPFFAGLRAVFEVLGGDFPHCSFDRHRVVLSVSMCACF
jgi:hypothetical protein